MRVKQRARLILAIGVAVLVCGSWLWSQGRPQRVLRDALVGILDTWLVPTVALDGFAVDGPTSVRLLGLRLVADDGKPLFSVEELGVELAAVPTEGEPIRIGRLHLRHPILYVRPDQNHAGFVPYGWDHLVEPDARANPNALQRDVRLTEVLDLRYVQIEDGEVWIADYGGEQLRFDGIDLELESDPTATPEGGSGHHARLTLGSPPGFVVKADARVDLDRKIVWLDQGTMAIGLSDPAAVARLAPGLRQVVEDHSLRGKVSGSLTGRLDLRNVRDSELTMQMSLADVHGAAGAWRLPISAGDVVVRFFERQAHIDHASFGLLDGTLTLSQGELSVVEDDIALAAHVSVDHIGVHGVLREEPPASAMAYLSAKGRVHIAAQDVALAGVLDELRLVLPDATPVLSIGHAEVANVQLHATGTPLTIGRVDLRDLLVDIQMDNGRPRGIPLPPEQPNTAAPPVDGPPWYAYVQVEETKFDNANVAFGRVGQSPWRIGSVSGTIHELGGNPLAPWSADLTTNGARVNAHGRLDIANPTLQVDGWSVHADIARDNVQQLLPPGIRQTVAALVPSGQFQGTGSATFPFGSAPVSVEMQLQLDQGAVAIPGILLPVVHGSASLSVGQHAVRLASVSLEGAGGTLELPAVVLDAENQLTMSLRAAGLRLQSLQTVTGRPVGMGLFSGEADLMVRLVDGPKGTAVGALRGTARGVSLDGDPVGVMRWREASVSAEPKPGQVLDVRLTVQGGDGARVEAQGSMAIGGTQVDWSQISGRVDLTNPSARAALPPTAQATLEGVRDGVLTLSGDGRLSLSDPLRDSSVAGVLGVENAAWHYAGFRMAGISGSTPVSLSDGSFRGAGGAFTGLGGRLGLDEGVWSLLDNEGFVRWTLGGLRLESLRATEGAPNQLVGAVAGDGRVELRLQAETGVTVTGGSGAIRVRDGRLLSLPALGAVARESSTADGDDALDIRFVLGPRGVDLRTIQVDLGPVRYAGQGEVRWSGALDVHLEASPRPGQRATLADLTARLVAWDVRGTLSSPHAQALPLGIDTRTFEQAAQDPRRALLSKDGDPVLGTAGDGLDELPESGARMAPPPADDRSQYGKFDDLDEE